MSDDYARDGCDRPPYDRSPVEPKLRPGDTVRFVVPRSDFLFGDYVVGRAGATWVDLLDDRGRPRRISIHHVVPSPPKGGVQQDYNTVAPGTSYGQPASGTLTNPKQRYGDAKPPLGLVPAAGLVAEALAMKQGAEKYGQANWRVTSVEAMTYAHAALRHIQAWIDGEDQDPDSAASHLGHARACLGIVLDAAACGKLIDNRPPPAPTGELIRALSKEVSQ